MSIVNGRPIHRRLLAASYVLGAFASLLGALAALGAAIDRDDLQYPPLSGISQVPNSFNGAGKKYFDQ